MFSEFDENTMVNKKIMVNRIARFIYENVLRFWFPKGMKYFLVRQYLRGNF